MTEFHEPELDERPRAEDPEIDVQGWSPESGNEPPKRLFLFLAVLVLIAAVAAAWWWWRSINREDPVGEPMATTAPAREVETPTEAMEEPEPVADAVELSASDAFLRQVAVTLSENPRFAAWLVNDDLVERFVKVVANVAYGEDPRTHIPFMRPGRAFAVAERGGATVISAASYARYRPIIETLESLDVEGSAQIYRRLEPAMVEVYDELGMPGTFEDTLERAAARVLDASVPSGEIEVVENVLSYRFADEELEGRSDFDKLLLRIGPENLERLKRVVRAHRAAVEAQDARAATEPPSR